MAAVGQFQREGSRRPAGFATLAIAALAALGLAQTGPGHSAVGGLGFSSQADRFTELAFAAPARLPSRVPAGTSRVALGFDLHNAERRATSYRWSIVQDGGTVLASGRLQLASGARAGIDRTVSVRCVPGRRIRVAVRLASPAQSIGFWTRCAKGGNG
jgi:hypothetical protein